MTHDYEVVYVVNKVCDLNVIANSISGYFDSYVL